MYLIYKRGLVVLKKVLLLIVFVFILTACSEPTTITQDEFKQLEEGMSLQEVEKIIGGKPDNVNEIEEDWLIEYEYTGKDGVEEESYVTLIFKDNELNTIIESGLVSQRGNDVEVAEQTTDNNNDSNNNEVDYQSEAETNADKHPATPGQMLYDTNEEKFKGMKYHFKGELVKTELVEGLFNNAEEALLVKNDVGFILIIFPNYPIDVSPGDEIEAWGPLSGEGYKSSDLGVDNVVGVTGAMNATRIDVNGEMK